MEIERKQGQIDTGGNDLMRMKLYFVPDFFCLRPNKQSETEMSFKQYREYRGLATSITNVVFERAMLHLILQCAHLTWKPYLI